MDQGGGDDGWEVAVKSNTARRHRVQKAAKRAERQQLQQMQEDADGDQEDEEEDEEDEEMEAQEADEAEEEGSGPAFESNVASVTADFAMQNVLLQMGLRLVTPDGRRIKEVHTWVLRCSACLTTTREVQEWVLPLSLGFAMPIFLRSHFLRVSAHITGRSDGCIFCPCSLQISRLFCPQCGNASLDKVELTIGPDGAEQFGVRKKHNLRGTRYSLPKPKGGKKTKDPVLREDVLMSKMPRRRTKPAKVEDDGGWVTEFGMASAVASASSNLTPGLQKVPLRSGPEAPLVLVPVPKPGGHPVVAALCPGWNFLMGSA